MGYHIFNKNIEFIQCRCIFYRNLYINLYINPSLLSARLGYSYIYIYIYIYIWLHGSGAFISPTSPPWRARRYFARLSVPHGGPCVHLGAICSFLWHNNTPKIKKWTFWGKKSPCGNTHRQTKLLNFKKWTLWEKKSPCGRSPGRQSLYIP